MNVILIVEQPDLGCMMKLVVVTCGAVVGLALLSGDRHVIARVTGTALVLAIVAGLAWWVWDRWFTSE